MGRIHDIATDLVEAALSDGLSYFKIDRTHLAFAGPSTVYSLWSAGAARYVPYGQTVNMLISDVQYLLTRAAALDPNLPIFLCDVFRETHFIAVTRTWAVSLVVASLAEYLNLDITMTAQRHKQQSVDYYTLHIDPTEDKSHGKQ